MGLKPIALHQAEELAQMIAAPRKLWQKMSQTFTKTLSEQK